jgi:hypothetical protein
MRATDIAVKFLRIFFRNGHITAVAVLLSSRHLDPEARSDFKIPVWTSREL